VRVRVPAALRDLTAGAAVVVVDVTGDVTVDVAVDVTVEDVLDALALSHASLERRIRDELGAVRPHVNLFVGEDNVRDVRGPATPVPDGADVSVVPAVSGG
jgi:molybdopterin synthase sulfur carrier subunit